MKAVIFDLGNVLVNYDGHDTFAGISELVGVSLETLLASFQPIDHAFGTGQLGGRGLHALLDKTFGLDASYETFASTFCRNQQRNEPALAFARELEAREQVKVGIISNTNEIHAAWLRSNLPELAEFSSVILSNEVGLLKPDPAIYTLALAQLEISADCALFVDDLAENVAGATAVQLSGITHSDWQVTRHDIDKWLKTDACS